jgi:uncharacterized membrane protein YfcA
VASSTVAGHGRTAVLATVLVGLVAGFLSGLFGVGGGILVVPGLVLALHMDQRLAHGTSLAAVLPISLASLVTYAAHGNVDWPAALVLTVGAVAGAVVGTRLLHVLPERVLALAFALLLVATAVRLFVHTDAVGRGDLTPPTVAGLVLVGLLAGVLAGLLGVGGGIVLIPAMVVLFSVAPVLAKGTSLAVIVPTALVGTWRNHRRGNVDLRAAAVVGLAGVVSAVAGASVADRISDEVSNSLFALLLVVMAARLLWGLWRSPRGRGRGPLEAATGPGAVDDVTGELAG